jgi:predicted nucleic acid-binding protein
MVVVADTSALVSLAISSDESPIHLVFREYEVLIPPAVVKELEEIASYDDTHAEAARRVLAQIDEEHIHEPSEQPEYPLDEGETAAIALANEVSADVFLCDEYGDLSTVHALLSSSRLLTTPKMIEALVLRGVLSAADAQAALSEIVDERSWRNNTYVSQFLSRFEERA